MIFGRALRHETSLAPTRPTKLMTTSLLPSPRLGRVLACGALFLALLATGRALPERNFETTRARAAEVTMMVELLERYNFNHQAVDSQQKPDLGQKLVQASV